MSHKIFIAVSIVAAVVIVILAWAYLGRMQGILEPAIPAEARLQCASYAPFFGDQSPADIGKGGSFSRERINADLDILSKRFKCVRTYSAAGMRELPPLVAAHGMTMLLGIWVNSDPIATAAEIRQAVVLAKEYPAVVQAVVVGNEALLRQEVTGTELAHYIQTVRHALPDVSLTYADVWEFWLKHPEVAPSVDFITIHILPYWEDIPIAVENAVAHVAEIYAKVARAYPDKQLLIGETGWPSQGRMREGALPSPVNQARFVRGVVSLAAAQGWSYNLIEAFDQPWKRFNEGAVGGYWGLYDRLRQDKQVFVGPVSNYPQWPLLAIASAVFVLVAGIGMSRKYTATVRAWMGWSVVAAAGAVLLVMQGEQFYIISRTFGESGFAGAILLLATLAYGVGLSFILSTREVTLKPVYCSAWRGIDLRRDGLSLFRFAVVLAAFVVSLGFVFDARYQSFPVYGFAVSALALSLVAQSSRQSTAGEEEIVLSIWLVASAVFILVNETWRNWQAAAWSAILIAIAFSAVRGLQWTALRKYAALLSGTVLTIAAAYAVSAAVRYGFMEARPIATLCMESDAPSWCALRSSIGFLIYLRAFGWLSIGIAGIALWRGGKGWALAALGVSVLGLVLYNLDKAAIGALLSLIAVARCCRASVSNGANCFSD